MKVPGAKASLLVRLVTASTNQMPRGCIHLATFNINANLWPTLLQPSRHLVYERVGVCFAGKVGFDLA